MLSCRNYATAHREGTRAMQLEVWEGELPVLEEVFRFFHIPSEKRKTWKKWKNSSKSRGRLSLSPIFRWVNIATPHE